MSRRTLYILRRGNSLYFRLSVPRELRTVIGSREVMRSLQTQHTHEAEPLALELAAATKRLFHKLRTMPVDPKKLAAVVRESKLKIKVSDLEEQREKEIGSLKANHASEIKRYRSAALLLAKNQRLIGENEGMRKALASKTAAPLPTPDLGEESSPPPTPATRTRAKGGKHKLSDALAPWKRLRKPSPATIEIYEAEARRFQTYHPGLHIAGIEKRHIREYIRHLQEDAKLSAKSVEKAHGAVRALLNIAKHEEWIRGDNPASGAMLPRDTSPDQRGFTHEELQKIFSDPVFTAGKRPIAGKGEASFWIPVLLLLTGARREEIAQLTPGDIQTKEGIDVISIKPTDDAGRVKNKQSRRLVPVHDQLKLIGFGDYVAERQKAVDRQLFPALKRNRRGQLGAKFGDWWSRYLRQKIGITDELISPAHSFRHSFITECRRLRMRTDYERALVGHTGEGGKEDAHDRYGEVPIDTLAEELNKITYRNLDLSGVTRSVA